MRGRLGWGRATAAAGAALVAGMVALPSTAGATIFFENVRKGGFYSATDSGKHVRKIKVPKAVHGEDPGLSPDGTLEIFGQRAGPNSTRYTIARTSTGRILRRGVVNGCYSGAGWAPDSKHFICTRFGTVSLKGKIFVVDARTFKATMLTDQGTGSQFAPNGGVLAWNEGQTVFTASAAGQGRQTLATVTDVHGADGARVAAFGPKSIAVFGRSAGQAYDIWLVDVNGGAVRRLTDFGASGGTCAAGLQPVDWSRDGTRLLGAGGFDQPIDINGNPTSDPDQSVDCMPGPRGAYAIDPASGQSRLLHANDGALPVLSRNGRKVLLTSRQSIYLVDYATGRAKRVLKNASHFFWTG